MLDELRSVLVKHGYTYRFGISLLHRHFDLAHDEVLMETTDTEARISTLAVERHEEQSANSIDTMWRCSIPTRSPWGNEVRFQMPLRQRPRTETFQGRLLSLTSGRTDGPPALCFR